MIRPPAGLPSATFLALALAALVGAPATGRAQTTSSHYVAAEDGTRLALDVHLPERTAGDRHPALLEITRYGRSREEASGPPLPALGELDRGFLEHGYSVVKVDARGSGASYGTRPAEYGPQEVADGRAIVDWVVGQPWSDGTVGAYGTSYSGTTAELLAAVEHPAVKAVIPGWSDFDVYRSPVRPYGLLASSFIRVWGAMVGALDNNEVSLLGDSIRRVDADADGALLAAAIEDHAANPDVFEVVQKAEFRDDVIAAGITWADVGPIAWRDAIERSGVPMLVLVSWMDAGTAEGALLRFRHFRNPQKLVVMASSHGGGAHASPYTVGAEPRPPQPSDAEQLALRLAFFDHHLKGVDNGVDGWPAIRYYNLGEEAFRDAESWPPPGVEERRFYPAPDAALVSQAPLAGRDDYRVDPGVSTGTQNRWTTQMGEPVLRLDDRAATDARMLTYTTAPLAEDLQIAGQAALTLQLSSDHADGMVLAYLEDVDSDGRSRYLTEGGLRLIHRRLADDRDLDEPGPHHSFARADARPMPPGERVEVQFELWPIAALVRRGHRLRLALAGADAGNFDPIPAEAAATLTLHRGPSTLLRLPVQTR